MPGLYRFRVTGRVQGVYFRQSTADRARQLGICGWVANTADGAVEGLAAGDEAALGQLRDWLRQGPPAARVETLDWQAAQNETAPDGFVVRR